MWLFTKHGFFSAVENFNDKDLIHVRANFSGDLERLCDAYGVTPNVKRVPGSDYTFRMDFPRPVWGEIVKQEALGVDYCKFKPAVHDGTKRDDAYLKVFFTMYDAKD